MSDTCRACGADVVWAVNEATGKRAPLDAELVAGGNVEAVGRTEATTGAIIVRYLKKGQDGRPGADRYISHFASCPNAGDFRRTQ